MSENEVKTQETAAESEAAEDRAEEQLQAGQEAEQSAEESAEQAASADAGTRFGMNPLQCLEAVLFAAGDPVPLTRLAELLEMEEAEVLSFLDLLKRSYEGDRHGIELRQVGDAYALATKPQANELLEAFFAKPPATVKLSQAAYETLAVIAYNEPVTRAQIDSVRGVNSDAALNRLIEKGLAEQSGTLDLPGRPSVFKTTDLFLRLYGIRSLKDLEPMDMLMYDTVQDFEKSYRLTRELAVRGEEEDLALAGEDPGLTELGPEASGESADGGEEEDA